MKFCFGDIVVVEKGLIGVVVKSWISANSRQHTYEVYVRMYNGIKTYDEEHMERYMVRGKYLSEDELEWQFNAVHGI